MRKIKVVVLLFRQLQHGFTKNAKESPNLTVAHMCHENIKINAFRHRIWHLHRHYNGTFSNTFSDGKSFF